MTIAESVHYLQHQAVGGKKAEPGFRLTGLATGF